LQIVDRKRGILGVFEGILTSEDLTERKKAAKVEVPQRDTSALAVDFYMDVADIQNRNRQPPLFHPEGC